MGAPSLGSPAQLAWGELRQRRSLTLQSCAACCGRLRAAAAAAADAAGLSLRAGAGPHACRACAQGIWQVVTSSVLSRPAAVSRATDHSRHHRM